LARQLLAENLLLSGSVAYMKNDIKNYLDVTFGPRIYGSTSAAGYTLPGAPKLTYSLSAQYTDTLTGAWDWFARGDFTHRDGMYLDTHNIAKTAPVDRLNLRAGIQTDMIRIEGYINNVFDNDPPRITSGNGARAGSNLCPAGPCNGNTYPGTWDALGRYVWMGATIDFLPPKRIALAPEPVLAPPPPPPAPPATQTCPDGSVILATDACPAPPPPPPPPPPEPERG
jgi:outer membrane receptor protein involved in Fe transport